MNKTILIIIGAGILLAGGWYFAFQKGGSSPLPISKPETSQTASGENGGAKTNTYTGGLQKILGLGKSLKCTWSAEGASGTSWIKNGKFYTEVSAQGYNSKAIMKDNCMWAWADGQTQGVKTCYDSTEKMYEEFQGSEEQSEPESQGDTGNMEILSGVEYNCEPANVADAKFTPPSDVSFTDMSEIVPQDVKDLQNMSEEDLQELQDKAKEMMPGGM